MKKIIHAIAVYGPIILSGIIVLFLLPLLFGWSFVPYNGYVWCGVSMTVCLLVCFCAKRDYVNKELPKIEESGILLLATLNTAWWIYVWSVVEHTVIMPFGVICIIFTMYIAFKLCDDTIKRTLGLMAGAMATVIGVIILVVPLLTPMPIIRDRFNVYNEQGIVAKVTSIRDAGNVYDIAIIAKKTGGNLGLGRFEGTEEVSVYYEIVDVSDYQKPQLSWQGADLYINGEYTEIYWE
ncbi:MAG TPA: hypothetical protein PK629_00800 [Oscillospiraceae bacterium]|nr:hypothetical protein [Oscillospiraceae bacterium]HPF56502.1 hypothetical protein [Clostridiales bacterium]HPK34520.1 hypothetical protein [Oscillospiraceae bacterium]HPR74748.1 hypothetical protein [Oscillospiraceae bacterium]